MVIQIGLEGIDKTIAGPVSKIRNFFAGWAKYTASNKFYDTRGRVGESWTLLNNEEIVEVDGFFTEDNRIYFVSVIPLSTHSFISTEL